MANEIFETAESLRATIHRARDAGADIRWLPRFPTDCCNFASNLLLLDLSDAGVEHVRRVIGTVSDDDDQRHVWIKAGKYDVDICADQFGQPSIIAEERSGWHGTLSEVKPLVPQCDLPDGIPADELVRVSGLYEDILAKLAPYR